ncbi:HAD family hydrolase [uncultured Alistipes sp.]|jgi:phosphoglycolate phosphatase|uniref:HAD family hydrolase n=1 Tax=uncultured Alistipes sp. TaxID=538949 RepID=UPI0025D0DE87|nr:HAD family hydrolase [uncultured Alistipes sp.]
MYRKYLFFDLDGTLTDPMQGITRSVRYALRHFGIEVADLRELTPFIGPPLADSFKERYGMTDTEAETAVAKYREYYAPKGIFENEVYPGIPSLLADTAAAGCVNVMATSKPTPFARQIAAHFGLEPYFRLISGSTLDGRRTTKADVIRHALGELEIAPREAVMIGDRRYDVEGAAETGLDSIAAGWGYAQPGELEAAHPGCFAPDVAALRRLLLGPA